jgi:hypothetical protein
MLKALLAHLVFSVWYSKSDTTQHNRTQRIGTQHDKKVDNHHNETRYRKAECHLCSVANKPLMLKVVMLSVMAPF